MMQFHATMDELLEFVHGCVADYELRIAGIKEHPFRAFPVVPSDLDSVFRDETVSRLALALTPLFVQAETFLKFSDRNPDAFILDIGRLVDGGLKESCLSARTSRGDELATWRKVANRLRKISRTGAVAVNPKTGASVHVNDHRFTEGALTLQRNGVVMLPVAGTATYTFLDT